MSSDTLILFFFSWLSHSRKRAEVKLPDRLRIFYFFCNALMIFKRKAHGLYFTVELNSMRKKRIRLSFLFWWCRRATLNLGEIIDHAQWLCYNREIEMEFELNNARWNFKQCFSYWITTICYTMRMCEWHDTFFDDKRSKYRKWFKNHSHSSEHSLLVSAARANRLQSNKIIISHVCSSCCIVVFQIFGIASGKIGIISQICFSKLEKKVAETARNWV